MGRPVRLKEGGTGEAVGEQRRKHWKMPETEGGRDRDDSRSLT